MDNRIYSGVFDTIDTHGGDVYIYGGKVEHLNTQGGDVNQYGGTIEHKIEYRESPRQQSVIDSLKAEIERLKAKLDEPDDDILVRRIESLKAQLIQERKAHEQEVGELKWRLDAITDIANGRNRKLYEDETNGHYIGVTDDSLDVLFTLINDYPISNDTDIAEEYGIPVSFIKHLAKMLKLAKSPDERRDARERLKRHNIEIVERRGGNHGNHPKTKAVEKVNKDGKVLATYKSIADAASRNGCCYETIKKYCNSKNPRYTNGGLTFRYKKSK
jgi:hypothetical protein